MISLLQVLPDTLLFQFDFNLANVRNVIEIWTIVISEIKCTLTLFGHFSRVTCLSFLGSTRLVSASFDKSIRIWNIEPNKNDMNRLTSVYFDCAPIFSLTILPFSNIIVSGNSEGTLRLWHDISDNQDQFSSFESDNPFPNSQIASDLTSSSSPYSQSLVPQTPVMPPLPTFFCNLRFFSPTQSFPSHPSVPISSFELEEESDGTESLSPGELDGHNTLPLRRHNESIEKKDDDSDLSHPSLLDPSPQPLPPPHVSPSFPTHPLPRLSPQYQYFYVYENEERPSTSPLNVLSFSSSTSPPKWSPLPLPPLHSPSHNTQHNNSNSSNHSDSPSSASSQSRGRFSNESGLTSYPISSLQNFPLPNYFVWAPETQEEERGSKSVLRDTQTADNTSLKTTNNVQCPGQTRCEGEKCGREDEDVGVNLSPSSSTQTPDLLNKSDQQSPEAINDSSQPNHERGDEVRPPLDLPQCSDLSPQSPHSGWTLLTHPTFTDLDGWSYASSFDSLMRKQRWGTSNPSPEGKTCRRRCWRRKVQVMRCLSSVQVSGQSSQEVLSASSGLICRGAVRGLAALDESRVCVMIEGERAVEVWDMGILIDPTVSSSSSVYTTEPTLKTTNSLSHHPHREIDLFLSSGILRDKLSVFHRVHAINDENLETLTELGESSLALQPPELKSCINSYSDPTPMNSPSPPLPSTTSFLSIAVSPSSQKYHQSSSSTPSPLSFLITGSSQGLLQIWDLSPRPEEERQPRSAPFNRFLEQREAPSPSLIGQWKCFEIDPSSCDRSGPIVNLSHSSLRVPFSTLTPQKNNNNIIINSNIINNPHPNAPQLKTQDLITTKEEMTRIDLISFSMKNHFYLLRLVVQDYPSSKGIFFHTSSSSSSPVLEKNNHERKKYRAHLTEFCPPVPLSAIETNWDPIVKLFSFPNTIIQSLNDITIDETPPSSLSILSSAPLTRHPDSHDPPQFDIQVLKYSTFLSKTLANDTLVPNSNN